LLDACSMSCSLDHVLDRPCRHGSIGPRAGEEPWAGLPTGGQDPFHGIEGSPRQECVPVFSALASPDEDQAPIPVEVFRAKANNLAASEPCGVDEEDVGPVSDVLYGGDESFDLVAAQNRREAPLATGARDAMDGIGPVEDVTEEEVQCAGDLVGERARSVVSLDACEYVGPDVVESARCAP